ncbi:hypothetical protein GCM10010384_51210 [Streptomyces djakartensis]|uniref:Uncharacterized protein n=1 Tax=Streptomyces djakartensis TaxID=68193 RepID=A0ABQ3A973_9ACTN|nr:hypothetical protein GCM10010384_51210 [Streptomyces djakartensis]
MLTTAIFCTQGWACVGAAAAVTEGRTAIAVALARIAADRRCKRVRFMIETPSRPGPSRPVAGEFPDGASENL